MKRLLLPFALGLLACIAVLQPLEGTARIGAAAAIAALAGGSLTLAVRRVVGDEAGVEPADAVHLGRPWPSRLADPVARRLPGRSRPTADTELATLEHAVAGALSDGLSAHLFLLPQLRTLAADRLRVERGVDAALQIVHAATDAPEQFQDSGGVRRFTVVRGREKSQVLGLEAPARSGTTRDDRHRLERLSRGPPVRDLPGWISDGGEQ